MIELHFFAGLTYREIGEVLGVSPVTVKRDWKTARLWLLSQIRPRRARAQLTMDKTSREPKMPGDVRPDRERTGNGAESWRKIRGVIADALDLPPAERLEFVREACGGDTSLYRHVWSYLDRAESEDDFLNEPIFSIHGQGEGLTSRPGADVMRVRSCSKT